MIKVFLGGLLIGLGMVLGKEMGAQLIIYLAAIGLLPILF